MSGGRIECDVLVIGGGMGGLTVGALAAQRGAEVVLVEATDHLGGSAALSGGYLWTAPDVEAFQDEDPAGNADRFRLLLSHIDQAYAWLDGLHLPSGDWETGIKGFGVGRQIDIGGYISRTRDIIESHGGWTILNTKATALVTGEDGSITGAFVENSSNGERGEIRARATVLATGGFQASTEMREAFLHAGAGHDLVLRSNPASRGDGINLGLEAGGSLTEQMDGYYGHLIPFPLESFEDADHVLLAQYHSEHSIIVDRDGRRFVDESLGDHVATQAVGRIRSGLMIIDERIRQNHVLKAYMSGLSGVDKLAEGGDRGAHYTSAETLVEMTAACEQWGYSAEGIRATIKEYNAYCHGETSQLDPPRKRYRHPIEVAPFAALEVQSAITFTYGGLRTDDDGRVLTEQGEPVPGLYAIGADAGDLNYRGYTGGLIRGFVFGHRLGGHLAAQLQVARRSG